MLNQTLGLFDHHFGDLNVALGGLIKGGGYNFALHRALHVGHFFRTLIDQQDQKINVWMVLGNRMGDILHQHRLTGARRGNDQRPLAFPKRGDQIDDAGRQFFFLLVVLAFDFQMQLFIGIERRQIVEINAMAHLIRVIEINLIDLQQGEIPFAIFWRADLAFNRIAGAQTKAPHLAGGNINIIRTGQIVGLRGAQEAEAILQHFQNAFPINGDVIHRQLLQAGEHQFLLAQIRGVFNFQFFREGEKFRWGFLFQFF